MNKQSYPEYLFKHLRRNSKRILSIMLAFAILTENPLSAYASTKATPSNIPESSASIESTDTNIDIDTDFGIEDFETNPDQDPDHGPGIDSTTPTYPYYRPVVDTSTIPDEVEMDNDDLDAILGAGANCIDDFDPGSLVPLTQQEIEFARTHENIVPDEEENEISSHIAVTATGALVALAFIAILCYSSAQTLTSNQNVYNTIDTYSQKDDSWSYNLTYKSAGQIYVKAIKASMLKTLKDKLDALKVETAQTLNLTTEDKEALAFAYHVTSDSAIVNFNPKNVNVKAFDGYKYYYLTTTSMDYAPTYIKVLYTPSPVAFSQTRSSTSGIFSLYRYIAPAKDEPFQEMAFKIAIYKLSQATGLYEFDSATDYPEKNNSKYLLNGVLERSLPFNTIPNYSDFSNFKNAYGSALMLDYANLNKSLSLEALMGLSSVAIPADIKPYTSDEKNINGLVTGLNQGAGAITGTTTKPGTGTGTDTETKPGTNTGSGGTGSTTDTSGALTSIIGIISSILTAASGIPNILSLFQALPNTIKESITDAISSAPFFRETLVYLSSIASGVGDILDWDIDVWIDNAASTVTDSIDDWGARWMEGLANLPNVDNLADIIERALTATALSPILDIRDAIKLWNADNYAEAVAKALEAALGTIGLGSLPDTVRALKDLTDARLSDVLEKLKELTGALTGLNVRIDLDALSDALKKVLTALGLGSLLGTLTDIGSMLKTFSLTDIMNLVKALPASIVAAITEALPNWKTPEIEENENDSGFHNFLNLFMIGLLIIILLMILFINCLRFIVLVFNVPASSALIHADMLRGIEYMKNLQIPVFGVSLYALLLSCAYFVIFMTVIAAIRRKIDKMHI